MKADGVKFGCLGLKVKTDECGPRQTASELAVLASNSIQTYEANTDGIRVVCSGFKVKTDVCRPRQTASELAVLA